MCSAGSGGTRDSDADGGTIYLVTPGAMEANSPDSREIKIDLTETAHAPRRASAACDYGAAARYARQASSGCCDRSGRASSNSKKNLYAARRAKAEAESPRQRPSYDASINDEFELGI